MMTLKTQDIHHSSSFPSILESYLNSEDLEKAVSVAKAVMQKKKEKRERVQRPVSAAELQKKKALLDQRHLVSYHRLHRLKDGLSQRYSKLLTEKVQKQRQEMKERDSKTKEQRSSQNSRGLSFQELVGSTLKELLELQRQLGQRECLQGIREEEVFRSWVNQSKTEQLEKQLQQMELTSKSAPELKLEDLLKKKLDVLPKIQSSLAESDDQQGHHGTFSENEEGRGEGEGEGGGGGGGGGGGVGVEVSSPVVHGKQTQEQDESERRFPSGFLQELQVPRFSTLQPSFSETFRTNGVPLRTDEPLHKSKAASEIKRKLFLMHSLAIINMAQSRSLLIKNGLTSQYNKGYSIQDRMERACPNRVLTKEQRRCSDPPLPAEPLGDHPTPQSSECIQEEIYRQAHQTACSELTKKMQNSYNRDKTTTDMVPLCMEDIYSSCISLGKTFDKKMWSNYVL